MTQNAKPILIAGGGMAGLLFALLLRQQGHHQVVLVEPMAMTLAEGPLSPSFDARSTALSAGTLSIFARLGLYETLLEDAAAIKTVEVSRKGRLGITRMRAEEEGVPALGDRKSTRLNSSHVAISYAVFCLKKKKKTHNICHM